MSSPDQTLAAPPAETEKPHAPAETVTAPADLVPPPRWWQRLAWYAGAMLLAVILETVGMQLWNRDLHAPFYYDLDALLYLPLARNVVENGFWSVWHTDRLGAPGTQDLYDFPIIDFLHFAILWLLGKVFSDLLLLYNVYSFLTYPLTVLTAMWVFRWLKLTLPTAALGALLYAFLPYHQERFQYHFFLAAYWWVPVSLVPAIALCRGDYPFFRRDPKGNYLPLNADWRLVRSTAAGAARGSRPAWKTVVANAWRGGWWLLRNLFTWRALGPIAVGVVTASAGAYYAFFACAAYAFAGVYASVVYRTWRGVVSAALVILPVVVVGFAYHIPTFIYQYQYGKNPLTSRAPHEAEAYGLKIAHLVLPTNDHNLRMFSNLRAHYAHPLRPADGESAGALGIIGSIGLVGLLGLALLPFRRRWPEGPIGALTMYLVLLASVGALGSLFNLIVTAQIRAYNRISVFIAFLCFFAVMWWLDRFLLTRTGTTMRKLRYPILAGLLVFGYFDETPWGWNPINPKAMASIDLFAERYRSDKRYFKKIEEAMPPGSKIFCLPYVTFPESPPAHKMAAYEHARGYILTDNLYWSYGALKNREADAWQKDVAYMLPSRPEEMLRRIVARGFDGLLIDGRGFAASRNVDTAVALIKRFNDEFRAQAWPLRPPFPQQLPEIVHEDGKQFFLDLRPFRDAWREKNPADFARHEVEESEWVAPLWLAGFHSSDPGNGERFIWGEQDATLILVNPTDRTRRFQITCDIGVDASGVFDFALSGLVTDSFSVERPHTRDEKYGVEKKYSVELPPGRSKIRIRCQPPDFYASDSSDLCYFIKNFKLSERP